jgi:hypothetical protein
MADEVIKNISVRVAADISDLEAALGRIPAEVQAAGSALQSSLVGASEAATRAVESLGVGVGQNTGLVIDLAKSADQLATSVAGVGSAAIGTNPQLALFSEYAERGAEQLTLFDTKSIEAADNMVQVGDAAAQAGAGTQSFTEQVEHNEAALEELGVGLTQIGKGLLVSGAAFSELTKEAVSFATESVELAGKIQFSEKALGAFFGEGEQTEQLLNRLKEIEETSIFDYPQLLSAAQRLAAMGVSADSTAKSLDAAALAAEAVGGSTASIESASTSLARIASTGEVSQRALLSLGLTWKDLGNQIGTSAGQAKEELGKLGDAETTLGIITDAIHAKFDPLRAEFAETLPVALNKFRNEWDAVLESVGVAIIPAFTSALQVAKPFLELVRDGAVWFGKLPEPVKDVAIGIGVVTAAAGPAALALGAITFAVGEIIEGVPKLVESITALTTSNEETAIAATTAAGALEHEGIAAKGAATGIAASGEAAAGASIGWKALAGSMLGYAAAAVAGFGIGDFLATETRKTGDELQKLSEYAATLGVVFHRTDASGDGLYNAIAKLDTIALKFGVSVDKGSMSTEEYAIALIKAIKAHEELSGTVATTSKAVKEIEEAQDKANAKLAQAKQVLDTLTQAYQQHKTLTDGTVVTQDLLNRATDNYTKALAEAHPVLADVTEAQKELNKVWDAGDQILSKIPDTFNEFEASGQRAAGLLSNVISELSKAEQAAASMPPGEALDGMKQWIGLLSQARDRLADYAEQQAELDAQIKSVNTSWDQTDKLLEKIPVDTAQYFQSIRDGGPKAAELLKQVTEELNKQKALLPTVTAENKDALENLIGLLEQEKTKLQTWTGAMQGWVTTVENGVKVMREAGPAAQGFTTSIENGVKVIREGDTATQGFQKTLENGVVVWQQHAAVAEKAAGAVSHVGDAYVYTRGHLEKASTLIDHVNANWDRHARALEEVTLQADGTTTAFYNLNSAAGQLEARSAAEVAAILDVGNALGTATGKALAAAAAFNSAWAAMGGRPDSSFNFGGQGNFSASGSSTLGMYASAGASYGQLDNIAQALGLVPVGNGQFMTLDAYNDMLKRSGSGAQLEQAAGGGFTTVFDNAGRTVSNYSNTVERATTVSQSYNDATTRGTTDVTQNSSAVLASTSATVNATSALGDFAATLDGTTAKIGAAGSQLAGTVAAGVAALKPAFSVIEQATAAYSASSPLKAPMVFSATATPATLPAVGGPANAATLGSGIAPLNVTVSVTGNNILDDATARSLANKVADQMVSKFRTVAGLRI